MLGEKFLGMVTAISAGIVTVKDADGTKYKQGIYKVKLESADIDYESMAKFNPNIAATLLNIVPVPYSGINFGDQSAYKMKIDFYSETQELFENKELNASYGNVLIKNLSVKMTENIPVYTFSLEIPMAVSGQFLFKSIKQRISFEFGEME